ncbi:retrovirus-related pol polyprotein from transposon TNT 1-94, partial [Trifolium medium]|nr:retrovirus-related pol polyprotein from transposon TNT 1-94 [Trifolium medium]
MAADGESSPKNSDFVKTPPSPSATNITQSTPSIHPAFTVPNISNFIKITLSIEKGQYNTWSELFKIHARVHQVIDHIIPPSPTDAATSSNLKDTNPNLWSRL